jgi:hypothetical protein
VPKPIPERIIAIVTILERLAADIEIIQNGAEILALTLPNGCEPHRRLLIEQSSALERISIGLGMIQDTVASLKEIRDHGQVIMDEAQTLALVKNGLDMVLASCDQPEDWQPMMLERAAYRFDQCVARIRKVAASLSEKETVLSDIEQRTSL